MHNYVNVIEEGTKDILFGTPEDPDHQRDVVKLTYGVEEDNKFGRRDKEGNMPILK